jgi:hypothetical protein
MLVGLTILKVIVRWMVWVCLSCRYHHLESAAQRMNQTQVMLAAERQNVDSLILGRLEGPQSK